MAAPFDRPWLIYACSPHNFEKHKLPRWDQWFEVHGTVPHHTRAPGYCEFVKTLPFVWVRDAEFAKQCVGAHLFPERELRGVLRTEQVDPNDPPELARKRVVEQTLGKFNYYAFTSSIAYMWAKAIDDCERLGIRKIGIFGVMQRSNYEYEYQKQGLQYFADESARRGIDVYAHDISWLFEPRADDW
jgi:hypothetical protein